MASAEQVKVLLRSHIEGDDEQFYSVAMQMAAHEAKLGYGNLAKELRSLIDKAKSLSSRSVVSNGVRHDLLSYFEHRLEMVVKEDK